jgi:hypothetical protein
MKRTAAQLRCIESYCEARARAAVTTAMFNRWADLAGVAIYEWGVVVSHFRHFAR